MALGMALSARMRLHSMPGRAIRTTGIFLSSQLFENGRKIVVALKAFGFGSRKITPEAFATPGRFIQLGDEPVRVDLLTSIEGCAFQRAWKNRAPGRYGAPRASFIGRDELIRNKEASARGGGIRSILTWCVRKGLPNAASDE